MSRNRSANVVAAFALTLVDRMNDALAAQAGRPMSDVASLVAVRHCESFNIGWLAVTLGLTHSAAVRIVDRLERDGLFRRLANEDGRAVTVGLTAAGSRLADQLLQCRQSVLDGLLGGLDDLELQKLSYLAARSLAVAIPDEASAYRACRLCREAVCTRCPVEAAEARATG